MRLYAPTASQAQGSTRKRPVDRRQSTLNAYTVPPLLRQGRPGIRNGSASMQFSPTLMSTLPPSKAKPRRSVPQITISRDAGPSAKGPRLQKLRTGLFLLDAVAAEENVQAYAGVEVAGDAHVRVATETGGSAYSEEDKNYGGDQAFTLATPTVINAMVGFADAWIAWHFSAPLRLGFYTTVSIGKEKATGVVGKLGLTLPEKPILELLRLRDYSDPNLLYCVKALVTAEYAEQYGGKSKPPGHAQLIQSWDDDTWRDFLSKIVWSFEAADEAECHVQLVEAVKKCRFYTARHEGRESLIAAALTELFDRKQLAAEFSQRFVHAADLELLFQRFLTDEISRDDPTWKAWSALPPPADQRNVGEKLIAACPSLSKSGLTRYQRRTADGLVELEAHSQDKNVLAMRYQIYDACEDAVRALATRSQSLTEPELEQQLEDLVRVAMQRVSQRAQDYGYHFQSESFVRGIILSLFDGCFLSLEETQS